MPTRTDLSGAAGPLGGAAGPGRPARQARRTARRSPARPASARRCSSTSTRTRTRRRPSLVADLRRGRRQAAARRCNRYPDREASRCAPTSRPTSPRAPGSPLDVEQVWAANGSNEVLQQVCQAFGGPGRVALGFEPSYSMHPLLAAGTSTGWVAERRAADFTLDAGSRGRRRRAAPPGDRRS